MEDYDGNSREAFLDEVIKRKHLNINGKDLRLPRGLNDRIFGKKVLDLSRTQIIYKDDGTVWASRCNCYRYKPDALSREVSYTLQSRYIEDFANTLQSVESVKGYPLDDSEINDVILLEKTAFSDRNALQKRFIRDFYKSAKL